MKRSLSLALTGAFLSSLVLSACGGPAPLPPQALMMRRAAPQFMSARAPRSATFRRMGASDKLRIATYNIRNLFDGIPNQGADPSFRERPKPERELVALGESFHHIDADVVGLQEVESIETLKQFQDRYLSDMGYSETILIEGNDRRGIDVALFSRYPVTDVKSHRDARFEVPGQGTMGFGRDLLQARIQGPNGYTFTVFIAHLKSQHGGDAADVRRLAEARKAREIIDNFKRQNPNENVLVMGDFNDVYNAEHIAPLVADPNFMHDIVHEEMGAKDWVYTYHPKKYRSRIDYILLNDKMKNEYVSRSAQLYKPRKEGNEWKQLYFYNASDHIPVTIEIDTTRDR